MKFFMPLAGDQSKADELWELARELMEACGFPTEPRRIHSLFFHRGEEPRVFQVDLENDETDDPVLVIFRAADAPFYWVCTMLNGLIDGAPIPVPARTVTRAVEFEPERAEPKRAGVKRRRAWAKSRARPASLRRRRQD